MTDTKGQFVWYELMTTDTAAAKAFYMAVVGWGAKDMPMPGMVYTMFEQGETGIAGLMTLPEAAKAMGAPPGWIGYVAVDDVDAATAEATKLGATVHMPPTDIPSVGRFSALSDPNGAALAFFKGNMAEGPKEDLHTLGHIGWHELCATDWQKAWAFYNKLLGWTKTEAMEVPGIGTYQLFGRGGDSIGAMFTKPSFIPATYWQYYFNVDDIDLAAARVTKNGGTIKNGPMEVPGGMWVLNADDPQGASFALLGKKS